MSKKYFLIVSQYYDSLYVARTIYDRMTEYDKL